MKPITEDRLKLLSLGYEPLANVDKECKVVGRNKIAIDEAQIQKWDRSYWDATGLRTGLLIGVDLDIEESGLVDAMRSLAFSILGPTEYIRIGKPPREMLCYGFDGEDGEIRKLLGAKYMNGSASVTHRVEVYGRGFYIGAFGKHSDMYDYTWPQKSLMDADIDDLPGVEASQLYRFMEEQAALFEAQGLVEVEADGRSGSHASWEQESHVLHDLELDTVIDGLTVSEWMSSLSGEDSSHRCSAVDLRPDASNATSMVLQLTPSGELCATDHPTGKVHMLSPEAVVALEDQTFSVIGSFAATVSDSETMFEESSEKWLLANIVTMSSGGYYDLSRFELLPAKVLNEMYGYHSLVTTGPRGGVHRTPPSARLAGKRDKLAAKDMCWQPVRDVDYQPIIKMDGHKYVNTFRAPDITPVEGDVSLWLTLVSHICGEHASLVLDHMAYTVQYPERKIAWQVLIYGEPRTGKTMMFEPMTRGMGSMAGIVSGEELKLGWGDVFARRKVLLVEEVFGFGRHMFNTLKSKFTNSGIEKLNIKGEKQVQQANLYSMYMLTNHPDAFEMNANEDKLLAVRGPAGQIYGKTQESEDFYNELGRLKDTYLYQAQVLHHLLGRDLSAFKYGALPIRTDTLVDMAYASKAGFEHALYELDADAKPPFTKVCVKLDIVLQTLHEAGYRQAHRKGVVATLQDLGYQDVKGQKKVAGKVDVERFWIKPENLTGDRPSELWELFSQNPDR